LGSYAREKRKRKGFPRFILFHCAILKTKRNISRNLEEEIEEGRGKEFMAGYYCF
jgi:hypothetical protein